MRWFGVVVIFLFLLALQSGYPQDVRVMMLRAKKKREEELVRKAKQEKQSAIKEATEIEKQILKDKTSLLKAISMLKKENSILKKKKDTLSKKLNEIIKQQEVLSDKRDQKKQELKELVLVIRAKTKQLCNLLDKSIQSAFLPNRQSRFKPVIEKLTFPAIEDIRSMVDVLFQEILLSGQVRFIKGANFIDRTGRETKGDVLLIGNFEAVYRLPDETGFLIYSPVSHRLFALSRLPPYRMIKKLNRYMDGNSDEVPVDVSKGTALRQLAYRLNLLEQIPKGGPIVIPILFIGFVALILVIERLIYLFKRDYKTDYLLEQFISYLSKGQWNRCVELCNREKQKPMFRVLLSGIKAGSVSKEELEEVLQESILNEIPKLERFLSTIIILAEISPLLGLLGTVTGIINTFHAITLYGTGDPRMMSSGISEALITTMLGLMVAIPTMFLHTLLSTKVENMISKMERAAILFINNLPRVKKGE